MRWIGLAVVITVNLLLAPLAAEAQAGKTHRIGFLSSLSYSGGQFQLEAVRQGLRDLGYVEDRTIVIEARWAEGNSRTWRGS